MCLDLVRFKDRVERLVMQRGRAIRSTQRAYSSARAQDRLETKQFEHNVCQATHAESYLISRRLGPLQFGLGLEGRVQTSAEAQEGASKDPSDSTQSVRGQLA